MTAPFEWPTPDIVRPSVVEALGRMGLEPRPLDAIATDIGELMAETVFSGIEQLGADYRAFLDRFEIGGKHDSF